jgi:hypothetical protein
MPYGVVLKDERPTSNIERPTSNEKTNIQYRTFNDYFFSAVLIVVTKILINSSVSSFSIQHSMLDVRCSMFIFFSPSWQKQLSAYGGFPLTSLHLKSVPTVRKLETFDKRA